VPVALYAVRPESDVSKRWIEVAPPAASQRRVATKRLDVDLDAAAAWQPGSPGCLLADTELEQLGLIRRHYVLGLGNHLSLNAAAGYRALKL